MRRISTNRLKLFGVRNPTRSMGAILGKRKTITGRTVDGETVGKFQTRNESAMSEGINVKVSNLSNLELEKVKCVDVGSYGKALLYWQGDEKVSAVAAKCTHYCAPLINGAQRGQRIRCPWHGACFNLITGDIEDYPGLDSLPKYQTSVESNGDVYIKSTVEELKLVRRMKPALSGVTNKANVFVIIGGGPASVTCAETLRQNGFNGRCVLISQEPFLPYDRPKLSKSLASSADSIALRSTDFFDKYGIELKLNQKVVKLDVEGKAVYLEDGHTIPYSKLMVATGGTPRGLTELPGHNLKNVCYLRTPADANNIANKAGGKRVVIIGTSFIGMEAASYLSDKASKVSVVGSSEVPFQRVFGVDIGRTVMQLCEEKGVTFYNNVQLSEFKGDENDNVRSVILANGVELDADVCLVGAGVLPSTQLFADTSVETNERKQVVVTKRMQTSVKDIFACGDIVMFPLFLVANKLVNVQHWQMAHQHGRIAALNMLDKQIDIHSVPYFWTSLCGHSIRYTGYGEGYDDIIMHGSFEERKFYAFFTRGDEICAAASLCFDPIVSQVAEIMAQGKTISKIEAKDKERGWVKKLEQ